MRYLILLGLIALVCSSHSFRKLQDVTDPTAVPPVVVPTDTTVPPTDTTVPPADTTTPPTDTTTPPTDTTTSPADTTIPPTDTTTPPTDTTTPPADTTIPPTDTTTPPTDTTIPPTDTTIPPTDTVPPVTTTDNTTSNETTPALNLTTLFNASGNYTLANTTCMTANNGSNASCNPTIQVVLDENNSSSINITYTFPSDESCGNLSSQIITVTYAYFNGMWIDLDPNSIFYLSRSAFRINNQTIVTALSDINNPAGGFCLQEWVNVNSNGSNFTTPTNKTWEGAWTAVSWVAGTPGMEDQMCCIPDVPVLISEDLVSGSVLYVMRAPQCESCGELSGLIDVQNFSIVNGGGFVANQANNATFFYYYLNGSLVFQSPQCAIAFQQIQPTACNTTTSTDIPADTTTPPADTTTPPADTTTPPADTTTPPADTTTPPTDTTTPPTDTTTPPTDTTTPPTDTTTPPTDTTTPPVDTTTPPTDTTTPPADTTTPPADTTTPPTDTTTPPVDTTIPPTDGTTPPPV
jgi:hypothetical protein